MRIEIPSSFPHESLALFAMSLVNILLAVAVSRAGARFAVEPDILERLEELEPVEEITPGSRSPAALA